MCGRIPFLTDGAAKKQPTFRKYGLLAIIFCLKYFPSPNANPTVKQKSLIQRFLLFQVGEESKETQPVVVKGLI